VEFDEEGVTCTRPNGSTEHVPWSELRAVIIQTTGNGPFVDDLFWMLVGRKSGCMVPSEAQGCDRLLERLQRLPNFDNKAVILASQAVFSLLETSGRSLNWSPATTRESAETRRL
jgi:hypothetical protein